MRRRWVPTLIAGALIMAGCSTGSVPEAPTSTTPTTSASDSSVRSVRWTTPAADLDTSDGTFVRAFMESFWLGIIGSDNIANTYPGFLDANHGAVRPKPEGLLGEIARRYHTIFLGLGGITLLPDGTARATICSWVDQGGRSGGDDFLDFRREGPPPPIKQSGPARRPVGDVFGGWYAVGFSSANRDPAVREVCNKTKPANPVEPNADPLPPFPGWPEKQ